MTSHGSRGGVAPHGQDSYQESSFVQHVAPQQGLSPSDPKNQFQFQSGENLGHERSTSMGPPPTIPSFEPARQGIARMAIRSTHANEPFNKPRKRAPSSNATSHQPEMKHQRSSYPLIAHPPATIGPNVQPQPAFALPLHQSGPANTNLLSTRLPHLASQPSPLNPNSDPRYLATPPLDPTSKGKGHSDSKHKSHKTSRKNKPSPTKDPQPHHLSPHDKSWTNIQPNLRSDLEHDDVPEFHTSLVPQPQSKAISTSELVTEVKSIYAGLVMIEAKAINVTNTQTAALSRMQAGKPPLEGQPAYADRWGPLIAIHRTLLHEHHDFFLASQHPSASQPLRELASKYSMPARMWKHGIHNFLELLRMRLPASLDYMLSFIFLAYQMVALLLETIPAFAETWIECLGDLSRYRMAIEEKDPKDREVWTHVARGWYQQAIDRNPSIGRLFHHQAILARTQPFLQLSLYSRSLTASTVFPNTRESFLTLLEPTMERKDPGPTHAHSTEILFIKMVACLFLKGPQQDFVATGNLYLSRLDLHIERVSTKFKEHGACIAFSLIGGIFRFALPSKIRDAVDKSRGDAEQQKVSTFFNAPEQFDQAIMNTNEDEMAGAAFSYLAKTLETCAKHHKDVNVLPLFHVALVLLLQLGPHSKEVNLPVAEMPWALMTDYLNSLAPHPKRVTARVDKDEFPVPPTPNGPYATRPSSDAATTLPEKQNRRPLFEDFWLRGQVWTQEYLPSRWCDEIAEDDEVRSWQMERRDVEEIRIERVQWLAARIARAKFAGMPISFDSKSRRFGIV